MKNIRLLAALFTGCLFMGSQNSLFADDAPADAIVYKSNAVAELATGSWCGWCTRATGAFTYYIKRYPGTNFQGRFIPIAVHVADEMTDNEYALNLPTNGYPSMIINRTGTATDVKNIERVEMHLKYGSYWTAEIKETKNNNGESVDVSFDIKCGYDNPDEELKYAIVLTENEVGPYYQNNSYSGNAEAYNELPSWLKSYVKPFYEMSSPFLTTYDFVARTIYPSYKGTKTNTGWVKDTPQSYTLQVPVPKTVSNIDNVSVVLLVIDGLGEIVASDIIESFTSASHPAISTSKPYFINGSEIRFEDGAKNVSLITAEGRTIYSGTPRNLPIMKNSIYILVIDGVSYKIFIK